MRGGTSKPIKFLIYFVLSSVILLIFWKIIDLLYMHLLVFTGNIVWRFFDLAVVMDISESGLHFIYRFATRESLSFTVHDADKVYLNLIILFSLVGATRLATGVKIAKAALISFAALFVIHFFMLTGYAYSHIWTFIGTQEADVQRRLIPLVTPLFSHNAADFFEYVLWHWNTWGWDVLPLLLWFALIYKQEKAGFGTTPLVQYIWGKNRRKKA